MDSFKIIDYLDGFQYKDAVLQFFPHAEGYVVNTQTTTVNGVKVDNYNYVYNYLDHLGNVRLSYAWDYNLNVLKIIEENGYYPFGLRHSGYNGNLEAHKAVANETKVELKGIPSGGGETVGINQNMVRFNHREWQSELSLNVTDMDFRQYNNDIGRFVTTDAITHYSQSPYHFANNNPMYFADPSGMDGIVFGMAGQTASSNPFPRGHDSFGNAPIRSGGGIFWGSTQSQYEQSWEAHNGVQTFTNPAEIAAIGNYYGLWSVEKIWIPGSGGNIHDGDPSVNRLDSVIVNGHWEKVGGWDNSSIALDIGGGIYGALQGMTSSQGYWLGNNGKYNSTSWGGNQYTGSRSGAFKAASNYKLAGRATVVGSVLLGGYMTYEGYVADGGKFGYNAQMAAASSAGSITGGIAGAEAGALIGASIGACFGGFGAIPGAVIGGVIGGFGLGMAGGYYGGQLGGSAVNYYHGR